MTVSRKHKRRIVVDGASYLWWVRDDETPRFVPAGDRVLHLCSESGELAIALPLGQPDATRHIEVVGRCFKGRDTRGSWHRYRCPDFCNAPSVTPGDVADLVRWCLEPDDGLVEVNYLGHATIGDPSEAG